MSGRLFDPDAHMREVRAAANLLAPATAATLLHDRQDRSNVATVANGHVTEIEDSRPVASRVPIWTQGRGSTSQKPERVAEWANKPSMIADASSTAGEARRRKRDGHPTNCFSAWRPSARIMFDQAMVGIFQRESLRTARSSEIAGKAI
jgi:hypothetical protein